MMNSDLARRPPLRHLRGTQTARGIGHEVEFVETLCGMWLPPRAFEGDAPLCPECARLDPLLGERAAA